MSSQTSSVRRVKPSRFLTVLEPPAQQFDGYGAFRVNEGRKVDLYLFRAIHADFGRGFEVEKLTPDLATAETYHVLLHGRESSCTCPGHTYHGHCRHVEGLTALDAAGKLSRPGRQKAVACPRCNDVAPDGYGGLCPGCEAEDAYCDAYDQLHEMEAAGLPTF